MIKPQFINYLDNSFSLFLENWILSKGSGMAGTSSYFYPIGRQFNKWIYAAPYQPFVADENISGNISPTGIYLSGSFVQRNTSGFVDYNLKRGWAIFDNYVGNHTKVSGNYTVADIQILPLDISEEKLLFEEKFERRKPNSLSVSGLSPNSYTYPAIYVKGGESVGISPYALGGEQLSEVNIGLIILAESAYQISALKSIICDMEEQIVPLLTTSPYNVYGGFSNTGTNYNYYTYSSGAKYYSGAYIKDVTVNTFNRSENANFNKLNSDIFYAIADITICKPRFSRSTTNNL